MVRDFYQEILNADYPYIIAELGANHNGDMKLAEKLIDSAKECGADCVKFQSWTKDSIFTKQKYKENYFLDDDYRERDDYTMAKIVEKFSMSESQLYEMFKYSNKNKIDFSSTPFSNQEVDYLTDKLDIPFVKVASMDLNNYDLLEYIAKKNKPIVLSVGFGKLYEIDKAIEIIEKAGNSKIIILHCIATYPTPDSDVNLKNIETLKRIYPYPVGFSDHSMGFAIPLAAAALGAAIIEKHFTLDREMFGWDHKISATPDELKIISKESKRISKSLGASRIVYPEDEKRKKEFRRSLVTTKALTAGTKILRENLNSKRPGTGIAPSEIDYVVGRKINKDKKEDETLNWSDFD